MLGLQCHTCMFVGGVLKDLKCKDVVHLTTTKATYRPCNNDGDALNESKKLIHVSGTCECTYLQNLNI